VSLKLNQRQLHHVVVIPKAVMAIAMAVIADAIVAVAANAASGVNGSSGQQAQPQIQPQAQRVPVKQNPAKKVVVVIAMVVPSALK
jgi:hypothetical protein